MIFDMKILVVFLAVLLIAQNVGATLLLRSTFEYGQTELFCNSANTPPGCTVNDGDLSTSVMESAACTGCIPATGPWDFVADNRHETGRLTRYSVVDAAHIPFSDPYTGKIPQGSYAVRVQNSSLANQSTGNIQMASLALGRDAWIQFWMARAVGQSGSFGSEDSADLDIANPGICMKNGPIFPYGTGYSWINLCNGNAEGDGGGTETDYLNEDGADSHWVTFNLNVETQFPSPCGSASTVGNWWDNCYFAANDMMGPDSWGNGVVSEQYAIRPNRWHLVKMHYANPTGLTDSTFEVWVDNRDGTGFHKITNRNGSGVNRSVCGKNCAPYWPDAQTFTGQFNFEHQVPAGGTSATWQIEYYDDIVAATSESDLPVYASVSSSSGSFSTIMIIPIAMSLFYYVFMLRIRRMRKRPQCSKI